MVRFSAYSISSYTIVCLFYYFLLEINCKNSDIWSFSSFNIVILNFVFFLKDYPQTIHFQGLKFIVFITYKYKERNVYNTPFQYLELNLSNLTFPNKRNLFGQHCTHDLRNRRWVGSYLESSSFKLLGGKNGVAIV